MTRKSLRSGHTSSNAGLGVCSAVQRNIHTYIHTYMHTCIHTYIHTHIHTYRHTDRDTDRQTDRRTYIQNAQTYMRTYVHRCIHACIHAHKQLNLTRFPVNTGTWCVFARDCMWASFQMSRSVETNSRGCHTQDMLNILTGSLLENEQDGESVILRDEETCSGECLTDDDKGQTRSQDVGDTLSPLSSPCSSVRTCFKQAP